VTAVKSIDDPVTHVQELRTGALTQRHGQQVLPYCAILLGLCLLAFAYPKTPSAIRNGATYLAPAVIAGLITAPSMPLFFVMTGVFLAVLNISPAKKNSELQALAIPWIIGAYILIDTLIHRNVVGNNLLGYSPIEGARYYGIGNEAMGAMAGGLLVTISHLWTTLQPHPHHPREGRSKRIAVIVGMLAVIVIVGAPSMGAKAGGVIVLTGAFATFLMTGYGRRLGLGGILIATLLGLIALTSMALLDGARSSTSQSHLGAAVSLIRHGGIEQALDIVGRKMAVELKLATHSTWALPVWAGLACILLQRRTASTWKSKVDALVNSGAVTADAVKTRPRMALLDSTLVAALLMLLFNDAGAVACALCLSIVCGYIAASPRS